MIPLFKPCLGSDELNALAEIFEAGWIGLGPKTAEFEARFAEYIGTGYAIGVNSCTAALHLAMMAQDIGPGDEVIVPTLTFVSTAHAVAYVGATPVFCDIEPDTLCISVDDLKQKITLRTKAVIPVHLGGHPCDMDAVAEAIAGRDVKVIEDVANAAGGEYKGRKLGGIGDIGCFSFEAKKNMTTGDGGMITTNDGSIVDRLRRLRWVGIDRDTWKRFSGGSSYTWYYEVSELGYKYNMNDIQAAIGLAQLRKLDRFNAEKRRIREKYIEQLADVPWLECPVERPWAHGAYWLFIVKVDRRDEFMTHLSQREIVTGMHFMPVHLHPYYRGFPANVPVADSVWKKIVSLPLFVGMRDDQIAEVVEAIKSFPA